MKELIVKSMFIPAMALQYAMVWPFVLEVMLKGDKK